MPAKAVQALFDAPFVPAPETQTGRDSQGTADKRFQFHAELESLGAPLNPNSFYGIIVFS